LDGNGRFRSGFSGISGMGGLFARQLSIVAGFAHLSLQQLSRSRAEPFKKIRPNINLTMHSQCKKEISNISRHANKLG